MSFADPFLIQTAVQVHVSRAVAVLDIVDTHTKNKNSLIITIFVGSS